MSHIPHVLWAGWSWEEGVCHVCGNVTHSISLPPSGNSAWWRHADCSQRVQLTLRSFNNKKAVLSQEEPRDAAENFNTYRILCVTFWRIFRCVLPASVGVNAAGAQGSEAPHPNIWPSGSIRPLCHLSSWSNTNNVMPSTVSIIISKSAKSNDEVSIMQRSLLL